MYGGKKNLMQDTVSRLALVTVSPVQFFSGLTSLVAATDFIVLSLTLTHSH